jgi:hypothetical protein
VSSKVWVRLFKYAFYAVSIICIGLVAYYGLTVSAFLRSAPPCSHHAVSLPPSPPGMRIEFRTEVCDYLVHSMTGTLVLIDRGKETAFLQYEGFDNPPRLAWDAKHRSLAVSLPFASEIYKLRSSVAGISIHYELGQVGF